ncbi:DUF1549 domain-containing protein [Rhodopirellula sp. MGV]|uniref:DUF1549 domain-containing protein n=1 Tax=Rhodopirellula sp. MGV TaxID=2023130 RepID=UPI000B96A0E1|nr:DUF1549 domain-containing protein [Rhodopirellula sp. MGV]OYP29378.1 hypothetical protein CGZ80_24520 [Rhodopirellula sp. MGV]
MDKCIRIGLAFLIGGVVGSVEIPSPLRAKAQSIEQSAGAAQGEPEGKVEGFEAKEAGTAAAAIESGPIASSDSRGEALSDWIDSRGENAWGTPPESCDDLTFARRAYLDLVGRVPSVSEIRDYRELGENRREQLVDELIFGEGPRRDAYIRLLASSLARQWRQVLLPPGTTTIGTPETLESWLRDAFSQNRPFDEIMRDLITLQSPQDGGGYYQLVGATPENYAGNLSRVMLGVRIDCAQCHDHPFTDWKQEDFWGLAAFYGDLQNVGVGADASRSTSRGTITHEGTTYTAKFLWEDDTLDAPARTPRVRLATWLTSKDNPNFAATAVNRFWQLLVGRGLYADVENLDLADEQERAFLDEFGQRFAAEGFDVHRLVAGIVKSDWYAAQAMAPSESLDSFQRDLKVISPEQVFDSLEQSLHLPISRIDPTAPRWTGVRDQMVNRLGEAIGASPEDYASGIPQALMMMNGRVTSEAISLESSRLLRAVVESPFFDETPGSKRSIWQCSPDSHRMKKKNL